MDVGRTANANVVCSGRIEYFERGAADREGSAATLAQDKG